MVALFASLLTKAGHENVWGVDPWAEHLEHIRRDGLKVRTGEHDETVRFSTALTPAEATFIWAGRRIKPSLSWWQLPGRKDCVSTWNGLRA